MYQNPKWVLMRYNFVCPPHFRLSPLRFTFSPLIGTTLVPLAALGAFGLASFVGVPFVGAPGKKIATGECRGREVAGGSAGDALPFFPRVQDSAFRIPRCPPS